MNHPLLSPAALELLPDRPQLRQRGGRGLTRQGHGRHPRRQGQRTPRGATPIQGRKQQTRLHSISLFQASSSIIVFDGDPVGRRVHGHNFALPPSTLHAGYVPLHVGTVLAPLVLPSQELPVLSVVLRVVLHCQCYKLRPSNCVLPAILGT